MGGKFNFKKDLEVSEKTEEEIVEILHDHFGDSFIEASYGEAFKHYDIKLVTTFQSVWLEVKEDFACKKYGNIAIEFSSRGKDSGIITTRAKFWLIKAHTPSGAELMSIRTADLRKLIDEKKYKRVASGGDGKTSQMYLFDLKLIKEYSIIIYEWEV